MYQFVSIFLLTIIVFSVPLLVLAHHCCTYPSVSWEFYWVSRLVLNPLLSFSPCSSRYTGDDGTLELTHLLSKYKERFSTVLGWPVLFPLLSSTPCPWFWLISKHFTIPCFSYSIFPSAENKIAPKVGLIVRCGISIYVVRTYFDKKG